MIAPMQFIKHYKFTIPTLAAALLLAGVSSLTAGLTGAIFTTDFTGTVVNGNQYDSPCSVYLDGGPGPHAPAHAAAIISFKLPTPAVRHCSVPTSSLTGASM